MAPFRPRKGSLSAFLAIVLVTLLVSTNSIRNVNLLVNGNFETPYVDNSRGRESFDNEILGWKGTAI
jgi:hypothetical protein